MFPRHAPASPKRMQDVQAAAVRLYSVTSAQLTTPGYGYSVDMTRQDSTTGRVMFSAADQ
jgi:hypothetical protein